MTSRYVVLGLAVPRSAWFRTVSRWANSAAVPLEFVKCLSAEELRARLAGGRSYSALLIDAALPALDRDLVDVTRSAGCAVIVVDDHRVIRDWSSLGPDAVINPLFERKDLLDALAAHAAPVARADDVVAAPQAPAPSGWRALIAMVCGPGGTGSSTVAIALAQGFGDDVRNASMVLLADLARRGEQAMLHDARDVVPGIQELVDAHRSGRPSVEEVRALTFAVTARRYDLLLGLRRARAWSTLRPRAFDAAFDTLTRGWRAVVCDTDCDLEGEDEGGSIDVEERNVMARAAASRADVILAVGNPGMKGLYSLVRVVGDLCDFGVDPARIIPVVNRSPRSVRARAECSRALAALSSTVVDPGRMPGPVFLPERPVDPLLRDGARLPSALVAPLVGAFEAVAVRTAAPEAAPPARVAPGSLGSWAEGDEDREAG